MGGMDGGEEMRNMAGSEELADVAALEAFLDNDDASVIGAFKPDDAALSDYQLAASSLQVLPI